MNARVIALLATVVVLSAAGCDTTGPERDLVVSGSVLADGSLDAVAGASVSIWSDADHSGTSQRLGQATTDVAGQYSLTASAPPNYDFANCTVMDVVVERDGYIAHEQPLQFSVAVPNTCLQGGSVTANFTLHPIEIGIGGSE